VRGQESEQDRGSEITRDVSNQLVGRTPHDLIAVFDGSPEQIGGIVTLRVEDVSSLTLFGRVEAVKLPLRSLSAASGNGHASGRSLPVVG